MRMWILASIFMILAHNCANATENDKENLVAIPDRGEKQLDVPIGPRLPHYDEITADDHPDHHPDDNSRVKFEDDSKQTPNTFDNEYNQGYFNIDKADTNALKHNENDRILTPDDHFDGEDDQNVDYEDPHSSHHEPNNFSSEENNEDDNSDQENDTGQAAVDDNDENFNTDYSESENVKNEAQNTNLEVIDMEQTDSEKESDSVKSNIAERATSEENEKKEIREPVKQQKRRGRGKPRFDSVSKNTLPITPNAYPGYSPYPSTGYPNPGDPNSGYSGYPYGYMPPSYPTYPTPYPTSPYPSPGYPSFSPYPPGYPGSYPGYPLYPSFQSPGDNRPQTHPIGYPAQNDQVTEPDTKHPIRDYSGATANPQGVPGRPDTYPGQDYSGYPPPTGYPGYGGYGYAADPNLPYGLHKPYPGYQGYYRPPRRPKTLTQRAVSAVAEALTSIALFDDKQCVPRLLCEVASGSAASSPTLQKATAGLTPLLTVLQSYNGMSSSPLFIFGRAAVLGMTTKGNPTACKYAYSECPNDPEGLVNYINNHNGGFFRFFGQPEGLKQPQDLEQFYNHLSGQYDYGQQQNQQPTQQQPVQQPYGYPYPYGMPYPYPHNYGLNYYNEQNSYRNSKGIKSEASHSKIEERIQNKPGIEVDDDKKEDGSKWAFPDEVSHKKQEDKPRRTRKQRAQKPRAPERPTRGDRGGGTLKFPDDRGPSEDQQDTGPQSFDREREFIRTQKGIYFPHPNHFNIYSNYQTTPVNLAEYDFDYKHNFYIKRPTPNTNTASKDEGETIYIVRGNGDPNHPEVVKVRPGQRL